MAQASRPRDLSTRRAIAVKLKIDYYIVLDFPGEKTVVIPEPTTERLLSEFRPAPANYPFNSAMQGFNYKDITAVNFRWMRLPNNKPLPCTVTLVEALAEKDSSIRNPVISIGAKQNTIPVLLKTGEYVEYWGEGQARIFDRNGVQLSTTKINDALMLETGDNRLNVDSRGSNASVKLTTILSGKALQY